jgi:hypothetical protein
MSDPEGFNIFNIEEYDETIDFLTILGDLIDSTHGMPKPKDFLEKKSFIPSEVKNCTLRSNLNL